MSTELIVAGALTVFVFTPWGQTLIKVLIGAIGSVVIIGIVFGILYLLTMVAI